MEIGRILIGFILCFSYDIRNCGADIIPVDKTYIAVAEEDLKIIWDFDNEGDVFNVEWSFQNKTASSPIAVMVKVSTNLALVVETGFNIEHDSNGNVTITEVTPENEGVYYCTVAYTGTIYPTVTGTATVKIEATTDAPPGCCCCLIDCKDIEIGVCYFANIMIYIIIFVVFSIIVGIVVEAIFNIWEKMDNWTWMILSFVFFLFGLGLFICNYIKKKIAANEPDENDSSNNSPGEIPLSKNQSHVMNTKYANPIGGQPDYAQPLQERPANFN